MNNNPASREGKAFIVLLSVSFNTGRNEEWTDKRPMFIVFKLMKTMLLLKSKQMSKLEIRILQI